MQYDYPFNQFEKVTPVGIEIVEGAEMLTDFEHPKNPLYVFGPEDGNIPQTARRFCHKFVFIPMAHCSNVAAAVYMVLYDRYLKRRQAGLENAQMPADVLDEPRGWQNFENDYYGDLGNNYINKSVGDMLDGK
jgi:hypothetical protein